MAKAKNGTEEPSEGGHSSHDTLEISRRKVKWRNLQRNGSRGSRCERKVKYIEQKRQRKLEERNRIVQKGRSCGLGRRTRGKRCDQRPAHGSSIKNEEDEARCLIEEMQRHLDAAQSDSSEGEQKLNRNLWEYIDASDRERGRPRLIMTKLWQLMQSKDLDEILSKIKQSRWSESTRTRRFWTQDEDEDQWSSQP